MQKNTEFSARLVQLIESQGISKNKFASLLGYERAQTIYDAINKGIVGFDLIKSIAELSANINISWLLTGKGEMYIEKKKNNTAAPDNKNVPKTQEYLDKCLECKKKDETIERLIKMLEQLNEKILKYERELELISENQPKSKLSSG